MANIIKQKGDMFAEDRREMTPARRKMIHDHRKHADSHGPKLSYELGIFKPKLGSKPKNIEFQCSCGRILWVSSITCGVVCPGCKEFRVVN